MMQQQNANEPIPVYAEMGSINPVFILPEILKQKGEEIAKALAASNLLSAGQFCTNPGIIIASDNEDAKKFQSAFAAVISNSNAERMLTESIHNAYQENIKRLSASNDAKQNQESKSTCKRKMCNSKYV